jgi:hypothetical protein
VAWWSLLRWLEEGLSGAVRKQGAVAAAMARVPTIAVLHEQPDCWARRRWRSMRASIRCSVPEKGRRESYAGSLIQCQAGPAPAARGARRRGDDPRRRGAFGPVDQDGIARRQSAQCAAETVQRVQQAIAELDYRPNFSARSLAGRRAT